MSSTSLGFIRVALAATVLTSCGLSGPDDAGGDVAVASAGLTAQQRLTACLQDPRVVVGLASKEICAGAGIFFQETFGGNGRTCGTCHPARHNLTIDAQF